MVVRGREATVTRLSSDADKLLSSLRYGSLNRLYLETLYGSTVVSELFSAKYVKCRDDKISLTRAGRIESELRRL